MIIHVIEPGETAYTIAMTMVFSRVDSQKMEY